MMKIICNLDLYIENIKIEHITNEVFLSKTVQVIKYRKRKRTKRTAQSRIANPSGFIPEFYERFKEYNKNNIRVPGKENYEFLEYSLKKYGWLVDYPVKLYPRRDGVWKMRDGHHRIQIAADVGIEYIPIYFGRGRNR